MRRAHEGIASFFNGLARRHHTRKERGSRCDTSSPAMYIAVRFSHLIFFLSLHSFRQSKKPAASRGFAKRVTATCDVFRLRLRSISRQGRSCSDRVCGGKARVGPPGRSVGGGGVSLASPATWKVREPSPGA